LVPPLISRGLTPCAYWFSALSFAGGFLDRPKGRIKKADKVFSKIESVTS